MKITKRCKKNKITENGVSYEAYLNVLWRGICTSQWFTMCKTGESGKKNNTNCCLGSLAQLPHQLLLLNCANPIILLTSSL